MERKTFFKLVGAGVVGGSLISYLESCKKSNSSIDAPVVDFTLDLSASANAALQNPGGSLVSNQVLIINNNGTYVALSDLCTHSGCGVGYNKGSNQIDCPCHGAKYDINGAVIAGPAPSALKQYNVAKTGNSLHVSG